MDNLFGRFGNIFYNKEFSPFRSLIFTQCQISHLSKLIKKLDYETIFNMPNYRLGIRYFDNNEREFFWKTTNKGCMRTRFFDIKYHEYVEYDKKMIFDNKMIEDSCFAHKKKNRKPAFYYKMNEIGKDYFDEYSNALINVYKSNNMYGLSKKIISNSIWFDLDNHDLSEINEAPQKLKKLLDILNISEEEIYYIEGNYFSGGIHLVIKVPYQLNKQFYEELEKQLKQLGCEIECNFTNKVLRLPCSYEYLPLKIGNISEKNYFKEEDYIDNLEGYINNLEEKTVNSTFLNNILEKTDKKQYNRIKSSLKLDELRKEYNNKSNPWNDYWNNHRELFIFNKTSNNQIHQPKELYPLRRGNRHETFKKVIPYMVLCGYSLEDVLKKLQEIQIDSKDMKHFDRLIKDITNFYNKCKETIKIKKQENEDLIEHKSNLSNLHKITLDFFENEDFKRYLVEKFIKNYKEVRNYNHKISSEKMDVFNKVIPYMIKEIIGKMYYHVNNKRTFKKENMKVYEGFQLSNKEIDLLQERCVKIFNLIDNPYRRTSIQYLKKALLKTLDIEEIWLFKHSRNWINGSCKSFRINSENDIRNVLLHLYNSCFHDIVNKKFILKNNNLNILYILLIEKWEIFKQDEIDYIKNHIPEDFNTS